MKHLDLTGLRIAFHGDFQRLIIAQLPSLRSLQSNLFVGLAQGHRNRLLVALFDGFLRLADQSNFVSTRLHFIELDPYLIFKGGLLAQYSVNDPVEKFWFRINLRLDGFQRNHQGLIVFQVNMAVVLNVKSGRIAIRLT